MKLGKAPGEFGWKALFLNYTRIGNDFFSDGWVLSQKFYFTEDEVISEMGRHQGSYKWPVEVWEDGTVYVPDKGELE